MSRRVVDGEISFASRLFVGARIVFFTLMVTLFSFSKKTLASTEQLYRFDIPAQSLAKSLGAISQETERLFLFPYDLVENKKSKRLLGYYTAQQALDRLLEGTNLSGELTDHETFTIKINNKKMTRGQGKMKTQKTILASMLAVMFGSVQAAEETAENTTEGEVERIVINGYAKSLQRSMSIKKDSSGVVDAISAEDIGKFPDENVAESLQRIAGVAISRERGEGKFVSVRGLGPAFTPVTLNGRTLTAGRTDLAGHTSFNPVAGRSFAFNILPSSVVSGLNVYKSPSADLIEGGIGGLIDMQTVRPLNTKDGSFNFSAQAVYEDEVEKVDPRISLGYTDKFLDDTLGIHISGGYSQRSVLENRLWHWGWAPMGVDDLGNGTGVDYDNAVYSWNATPSTLEGDFERASIVGVIQYKPSDRLDITIDALYSDYTSNVTEIQLSHRAENGSFTGDFADPFIYQGNAFPFRMYDISVDPNTNRITRWSSYDPNSDALKPVTMTSREEKNKLLTETVGIGGNVLYSGDAFTISGDIAYSKAESTWDMRWAGFEADFLVDWSFEDPTAQMPTINISKDPSGPGNYDPNLVNDPSNWYMRGMVLRLNEVEDEEFSTKLDLDFDIDMGALTMLEVGVRYADRTKTSVRWGADIYNGALFGSLGSELGLTVNGSNGFLNVADANIPTNPMLGGNYNFVNTNLNQWVVPNVDAIFNMFEGVSTLNVGENGQLRLDDNGNPVSVTPILSGRALPLQAFSGFDVQEKSLAIYLKQNFELDWDMPISGNFGVRWVQTDNTTAGQSPTENIVFEGNEILSDGNPQRVSVDTSYTELLPSFMGKIELTEELIARIGVGKSLTRPDLDKIGPNISVEPSNPPTGAAGNPDLDPFTAWNYDASLEWYFSQSGYLSGGYFHKEIDGFVQSQTQRNVVLFGQTFATFTRPENAGTASLSGFELAYQQTFDFLAEPFNGFGVQANYTHITSDTSLDEGFELSAALEKVGFQGLSENNYNAVVFYENERFSGRLSYNYRSEYFTGFNIFSPRVQEGYGQLDASFSYRLTDDLELTLELVNLNKGKFEHYDNANKDFASEITQTGRKVFLGIRGSIGL